MNSPEQIIADALNAKTYEDAVTVQNAIASLVGASHWRPVGDKWNNAGTLAAAGGSFDHKIIEDVTNMQDAVLELAAILKFGDLSSVPYRTPKEAAEELLNPNTVADDLVVEFCESDPPTASTKRLTAVFRDRGCGMTPESIPVTIFGVGGSHKTDWDWLQGSYGLGGETTFKNAKAVVLVTRRDPQLLKPYEDDKIAVAVVQWNEYKRMKSAQYLVTALWEKPGDRAFPFAIAARKYPDFAPGTHLALISYGVEGFHRARGGGDEKSFEAVLNTRLFKSVTPVKFRNHLLERARDADTLRGLFKRLRDNPRDDRREGQETLPYNVDGTTYHLPVSFYVFSKPGEKGERRNFVARDHAVVFTSNGQVHHHWTASDFRYKTKLSKLHDRIFVVVETDELPLEVRNTFFTADRQQLVRNDPAIRLEDEVTGFLDEWDELKEINSTLIREAITANHDSRPTINIAKQIGRALSIRGFSIAAQRSEGGHGGRTRSKHSRQEIDLLSDPTTLEGPERVVAEEGKTKFITYVVNAENDFIPKRGTLRVECTHAEITPRDITVGTLRGGRIRVSVAVPLGVQHGTFQVKASLSDWMKSSGGIGVPFEWSSDFEVVEERDRPSAGTGNRQSSGTASEGNLVGIIWKSHDEQEDWSKMTVGDVLMVAAEQLAKERSEYAEIASLGSREIPTIILNSTFVGLKQYLDSRARRVSETTLDQKRDQYAVGVGVGLCMLHQDLERRRAAEERLPDEAWLNTTKDAIARGVLSMMPAFDELANQAGLED
jgi:hypothetical protein